MGANSDKKARLWYSEKLQQEGYKIIGNMPVDIVAEKNGEIFYFEIKSQNQKVTEKSIYDGMVNLRQLICAKEHEKRFFFVILRKKSGEESYHVFKMTLNDLLTHLSGNWRIEYNFHLNFKSHSTSNIKIMDGKRVDKDKIREDIDKLSKLLLF